MRWLVLFLMLANAVVWFQATRVPAPPENPGVSTDGQLPRVADLRPEPGSDQGSEDHGSPGVADDGAEDAPPDTRTEAREMEQACMRVRWFDSREAAGEYRDSFRPDAEIRELEEALAPLHWVIIPPRPEPQALELFRELQGRGIDSYLVMEGENRNAISLGLFESPAAARRVLDERKSQNLNAVLAKFPRNQISYALDFLVSPGSDPGKGLVLDSWRGDSLELIEISGCQGVASVEKNP